MDLSIGGSVQIFIVFADEWKFPRPHIGDGDAPRFFHAILLGWQVKHPDRREGNLQAIQLGQKILQGFVCLGRIGRVFFWELKFTHKERLPYVPGSDNRIIQALPIVFPV